MEGRISGCEHPFVIDKTVGITQEGQTQVIGYRVRYECGQCGEQAGFEGFDYLSAAEYNAGNRRAGRQVKRCCGH